MPTAVTSYDWKTVARAIDHTILKTEARPDQVSQLCREALKHGFFSVCVQPSYIELCCSELKSSPVKVATVIGFPQGATFSSVKRFESQEAVRLGAHELDMVINVGALKSGNRDYVQNEIHSLATVAHDGGAILKVIIETALLSREEKILACELSVAAGADFVKTSTGFSSAGATVEDVALMRSVVGPDIGVKAAGGIRTAADAVAMLKAGANRLGASASIAIIRELGAPE